MISAAKRSTLLACGALVLLVLALYAHAFSCSFVNFDDNSHITENPMVLGGLQWESIKSAFTEPHASLWIPITWISFMADVSLFGLNATAMHAENVFLHAANVVLLFLLLKRATQRFWASAGVALLFAIHPINVESVAWVTERKNVLCLFFGLLSLHAYTSWVLRASKTAYALALGCFALALLAKPMLVPLPAGLLLLDVWPFRRLDWTNWGKRALEKLPFLSLSMASSLMTMQAAKGSGAALSMVSIESRISNALIAYGTYLCQLAWPKDLCVLYPHTRGVDVMWGSVSLVALAGITIAAWRFRRQHPYLLVGWLWFLGMLVPMIGLVQVGTQSHADRFTYAAQLGIFIAVIWLIADLCQNRPRRLLVYMASIVGIGFSLVTLMQVEHWTNGATLFEHTAAVTKNNYRAYHVAGLARSALGDYAAAINHHKKSLLIEPRRSETWCNLSAAFLNVGRHADAAFSAKKALELEPDFKEARFNLASAFELSGDTSGAIAEFRKVVQADPTMARAQYQLGTLLAKQGDNDGARQALAEAKRLLPNDQKVTEALSKIPENAAPAISGSNDTADAAH